MYTGPVGSTKLTEQVHDYNVHIDRNDVFWMIPVKHDALEVDLDDERARLRVSGLDVFDDHDIANSLTQGLGIPTPPIPPIFPVRAKVSFDIEWNGALDSAQIRNTSQRFKGTFFATQTTIQWSAEQAGFTFESEPPNPARNVISVIGREQNGVFFA